MVLDGAGPFVMQGEYWDAALTQFGSNSPARSAHGGSSFADVLAKLVEVHQREVGDLQAQISKLQHALGGKALHGVAHNGSAASSATRQGARKKGRPTSIPTSPKPRGRTVILDDGNSSCGASVEDDVPQLPRASSRKANEADNLKESGILPQPGRHRDDGNVVDIDHVPEFVVELTFAEQSDLTQQETLTEVSKAPTKIAPDDEMSVATDVDFMPDWVYRWRTLVASAMDGAVTGLVALREEWKAADSYVKVHLREVSTLRKLHQRASISARMATIRGAQVSQIPIALDPGDVDPGDGEEDKIYWFILDPASIKRLVWILVGMLLMLYDVIMLPMQVFDLPDHTFFDIAGYCTQIFWTVDIGVSFVTGVFVNMEVERRLHVIAAVYARSWLLLDLIVTMPLWLVLLFGWDRSGTQSLKAAKYMRMLRFLRLVRLAKMEKLFNESLDTVNSSAVILGLGVAKLIFLLTLVNHVNACLWYAIGDTDDHFMRWPESEAVSGRDILYKYLSSMHWAVTQFQGTSDVLPGHSTAERAYAVCTVIVALIMLSSFVSTLTNMMMKFQSMYASLTHQDEIVRAYLSANSLSMQLSVRVKKYIAWKQLLEKKREVDTALPQILPQTMLMDVLFEVRAPQLATYSFFSVTLHFPRVMRRFCTEAVDLVWPHPNEVLFKLGDEGTRMYFVVEGMLTYTHLQRASRHKELRTASAINSELLGEDEHSAMVASIHRGQYLSEGSIWVKWEHLGDCFAPSSLNSSCSVLALVVVEFIKVVSANRPVHAVGVHSAKRFAQQYNCYGKHYSDFIESGVLDLGLEELEAPREDENEVNFWRPRAFR